MNKTILLIFLIINACFEIYCAVNFFIDKDVIWLILIAVFAFETIIDYRQYKKLN